MVRLILAFAFNWPLMYAVRISVKECPPTNTTWKARERNFDCISPKVYHCIQDDRGILMETCMTPHLVNPSLNGGCPWALHTESGITVLGGVFNSCSGTGCPKPDDPKYWTYQLYKYPICLHNDALTTTQTTVSKSPNKKESTSTNLDVLHDSTMSMKDKKLLLLGITLAGLALVLLTVVAVVMCRMKSRQHKGHSENIDVEDGYPLQDKPEETDPFLEEDGEVVENKRMESQVAHQSVIISEVRNTPDEEQQKKARYDVVYRPEKDHNQHGGDENIPLLELDEDMLQKGKAALEEHHLDTTYVPTQGFIWATEVMLTHNVAVISGIVSSGKTKTALHTASTWKEEDEHRRLLLIESVNEISNALKRNLENVIIVMDDCFTRWSLECSEGSLSSTCAELYRRVCHSNNVKLIITIDYNIYQRHKHWLSHIDLFKEHLVITLPIEMAVQADFTRNRPNMEELLQEERKKILQSHIDHYNAQENHNIIAETKSQFHIDLEDKDISEIISRQYVNIGFPSLCTMYVRLNEIAKLKPDFFQFCDTRILNILEMKSEGVKGKQKRCVLYYAMLKDKCLDLDDLDLGLLNKLGKRYKLEPYNLDTVISIVKDLSNTFLIQTKNKIFKIADTVVYNKCIHKWTQKRPHDFLELCSVTLIKELIRPVGYQPRSGESIFLVKEAAHITHLAQRFKELLPRHPELKNHPMMSNKDFQKEMEKQEQRREFADNVYDNYDNTYEDIMDSVADPEKG